MLTTCKNPTATKPAYNQLSNSMFHNNLFQNCSMQAAIYSSATVANYSKEQSAVFAKKILDQAVNIILILYPNSSSKQNNCNSSKVKLTNLKYFIKEILRKSNSKAITLQLALKYLINMKIMERNNLISKELKSNLIFHCGRRMFLSSLIITSKIILEPAAKNSAWSKISGLPIQEINNGERLLLSCLDYKLYLPLEEFIDWHIILLKSNNLMEVFKKVHLI
ncbi:hypothetical protein HDU92_005165 [Lobulomyces angularis]|nr:hypothetical protein HDU92_005165 [Lobulomyces angularis]